MQAIFNINKGSLAPKQQLASIKDFLHISKEVT